jgi:Protein of unknown function (DUF2849)
MNILTGNDLSSGDVVWWDGKGWSRRVEEAVAIEGDGAAVIASESAAERVNAAYAVEAVDGLPVHIKDRVRAAGPTVRTDLGINPSIQIVKS